MVHYKGFTVWFTGLSGTGKTTLASILEKELLSRGVPYVQRLDGDIVRDSLSRDLGFSRKDREENVRRNAFVARLLAANGTVVLASFISPYKESRALARLECEQAGSFIEVFVSCSMETLLSRDPKGLYKKAMTGEIESFTGISDPYDVPECPEVIVHTDKEIPEESLTAVLEYLESVRLIPKNK